MFYQSFPLTDVRPKQRFERFSHLVNELFSPTVCQVENRHRDSFDGQLGVADLGMLKMANVASSALDVSRRLADIAQVDEASYLIKFQLSGHSTLQQCGNIAELSPGDFVVCSTADPYRLRFQGPYRMSVLAITADNAWQLFRGMDSLLGRRMCGADPSCGLLSNFVSSVSGKLVSLPDSMARRVENNLLDLLGGVVNATTKSSARARQPAAKTLSAVQKFIQANLNDRRLGPAMIAARFGISVRYLHKLFAEQPETLTRWIRRQRLHASCQMIKDPSCNHLSITEIALHWGFYDLSHLTHGFNENFGMSPSAMRASQGLARTENSVAELRSDK